MKIIIDASAAFIMLAAPAQVVEVFADATDVLAPELIVAELLNAHWKIARSGAAAPSLKAVLGLFDRIHLVAAVPYTVDAAMLAQRLDHPAYDCLYAVLAKRENASLATADRRFARKLADESRRDCPVEPGDAYACSGACTAFRYSCRLASMMG